MKDKWTTEKVSMLTAIVIGGIYGVLYPEQVKDAFTYTVGACVLIRLFW